VNDLIARNTAAACWRGTSFYGYLPGGAFGGILPASMADIPLDFDRLNQYGLLHSAPRRGS